LRLYFLALLAKIPAEILEESYDFLLAEERPVLRGVDDPVIKEGAVSVIPAKGERPAKSFSFFGFI
jgi:hypothetical protein